MNTIEVGDTIRVIDPFLPWGEATVVDPDTAGPDAFDEHGELIATGGLFSDYMMPGEFTAVPTDPEFNEGCLYFRHTDENIRWERA